LLIDKLVYREKMRMEDMNVSDAKIRKKYKK